ncbi:hypothetical protein NLJ89_g5464 [Agrocybe chaxingu]|uniref:Uncharacterized protein n=1 Tax=Agrocybe chaxingu TaxID=84603 RepID=A0A9W8K784_9AGAR|nr:hypothetical protein NLJ89_g5464 [Agrocybe chaxingu]
MSIDPDAFIVLERSSYLGDFVSSVLLGVEIALFFQSAYYLCHGAYSQRKRTFFIVYGFVLVFLVGTAAVTRKALGAGMWIDHRDELPGGPAQWWIEHNSWWVNILGLSVVVAADAMSNGLMMYRCYILLSSNIWVIVVPALLFISSFTLGVMTIVAGSRPGTSFFSGQALAFGVPWIALTVSFNVLVTVLICGRLLSTYFAMRNAGASESMRDRLGIIAILIESALPFSVFGIALSILYGLGSQTTVAFADIWGNMVGISPQLIILRVAMGRAWTKETINTTRAPVFATRPRDPHTTQIFISQTEMQAMDHAKTEGDNSNDDSEYYDYS